MSDDGRLGETLGRYRLDSVIGQGGFATVYRAKDTVLERPVALKVLDSAAGRDPNNSRRFLREGRAVASLEHPAIVPVYDAGEDDGTAWMAMRLVEGGALDRHLAQGRRFRPEETLAIVRRIASALDHAHEQDLLHRDVKPSNILLDGGSADAAWLTDFGIAVTARNMGLYTTGALGTAAYMAPEQARPNQAGPSADLYSLACVAYELLTGNRPFPGDDYVQLLMCHANDPVPLTGVDEVDAFMASALAKNVEDRPSNGRELTERLEKALAPTPAVNRPATDAPTLAPGTAPPADAASADPAAPGATDGAGSAGSAGSADASPEGPAPGSLGEVPARSDPAEAVTVADLSDRTLVHPEAPRPRPPDPDAAPPPPPGGDPRPAPPHPSPSVGNPSPGPPPGSPDSPVTGRYEAARRSSYRSLGLALGLLLVAVVALLSIYLLNLSGDGNGDRGELRTIRDEQGAVYSVPRDWEANDGGNGVQLVADGEEMLRVESSEATALSGDAEDRLAEAGRICTDTSAVSPMPSVGGADSMARCPAEGGGIAIAAVADGRLWTFQFTNAVSEGDRSEVLDSLEFTS